MTDLEQQQARARWPLLIAGSLLAAVCTLRLLVALTPTPFFDADPALGITAIADLGRPAATFFDVATASMSAITPSGSIAIDGVIILLCAVVLGCSGGVPLLWLGLATFGSLWAAHSVCLMLATHAFFQLSLGSPTPEDIRIGSSWVAAIMALLAGTSLARDGHARALAAGVLIGVVALLALKGTMQVFVEHPQTVAMFDADPDSALRARGFEPGSTQALIYERRLRQPEATGWIALSNVFATLVGASLIVVATVAWRARGAIRIVAALLGLSALFALVLSGSKGGIAATLCGFGVLIAAPWLAARLKRPKLAGLIGLAAIGLPLLAVAVRGLIGTGLSELSILFRWFYLIGATRITAEHPGLGVGPGGFQNAYAIHKPPISPEDVASPHSVLFDFAATLGIGGFAWCLLIGLVAWQLGKVFVPRSGADEPKALALRPRLYIAAGAIVPIAFLALWLDRGAALPLVIGSGLAADPIPMWALFAGLAAWSLALGGWIALAAMLPTASERTVTLALAGAAIAAIAHAQIEMTATQPATSAWFFLLLGLAAPANSRATVPRVVVAVVLMMVVLQGVLMRWSEAVERDVLLTRAAQRLAPIGELRAELDDAVGDGSPRQRLAPLADRVSQRLGQRVPPRADILAQAIAELALTARVAAGAILAPTRANSLPDDPAVLRAYARNAIALLAETGDDRLLPEPIAEVGDALRFLDGDPGVMIAEANLHLAQGMPGNIATAVGLLLQAADHRPHDLQLARRLERLLREHAELLGTGDQWRAWAERALEIDGRLGLDPLVQLTESERNGLRRRLEQP